MKLKEQALSGVGSYSRYTSTLWLADDYTKQLHVFAVSTCNAGQEKHCTRDSKNPPFQLINAVKDLMTLLPCVI